METFYDSYGDAIAYIDNDNTSIYLYDGTPIAWINDESLYAYSGRYLGWMYNGWIYDRDGYPMFFTENASGGPSRPMKKMKPMRGMRGMRPMKGMREMRPLKPVRSTTWSSLGNDEYFDQ